MNTLLAPSALLLLFLTLTIREALTLPSRRRRIRASASAAILRGRRRDSLASPLARAIPPSALVIFGD